MKRPFCPYCLDGLVYSDGFGSFYCGCCGRNVKV